MIDIHMHVIPGVDDGAVDFNMAHEMVDMAYAQGVRGIIATPHADSFHRRADQIKRNFAHLQAYVQQKYPDMLLALGAEVYCDMPFLPDTRYQLKQQRIPALNDSKLILSEFSPFAEQDEVRTVLTALLSDGWKPVVAHTERSPYAFSDLNFVREMITKGCMIQVNAYSLSEETNDTIRTLAQNLLSNQLIHFLGSDAHRTTHRAPKVEKGISYIHEHCPAEYAEAILYKNAQRLLFALPDKDDFLGGMLGLAAGDALGVPYEFKSREEMHSHPAVGMIGGGAHGQPVGTWSDDTSMALCCADSLRSGFDLDDMMKRFTAWYDHAKYTASGVVFGCGITCRQAIRRFQMGYDVENCGINDEQSNGNGALMRIFPVSFWRVLTELKSDLTDEQLLAPIHASTALTHAHPRNLICCGIYTLFIDEWLKRTPSDSPLSVFRRAYERASALYRSMGGQFTAEIDVPSRFLSPDELTALEEHQVGSGGYVLHTLHAALWCLLTTSNFADCVLKAVNLGEDTDTTAAVAGSLAGLVYGTGSIPSQWLNVLKKRDMIVEISSELYRSMTAAPESSDISAFIKQHAHLALKYSADITIDGLTYSNATAAYLALRLPEEYEELRESFTPLNAHKAYRLFKQIAPHDLRKNVPVDILYRVCLAKYEQNPELLEKLLSTGERQLIYDTTGAHDNLYGWCRCRLCADREHKNILGETLMRVRTDLKKK